jgi:hypothetical protein
LLHCHHTVTATPRCAARWHCQVEPVFKARIQKHYDKAWAAAFLVDPVNAVKGNRGWYLNFDELRDYQVTEAQECFTELAGGGADAKAAVAKELGKLQVEPLPESMARTLPTLTEHTQLAGGKVQLASAVARRAWWDRAAHHFPHIAPAAVRLLSFHVTSCAAERNWSRWGHVCKKARNRLGLERAEMLVAIEAHGAAAAAERKGNQGVQPDDEVLLRLLGQPDSSPDSDDE